MELCRKEADLVYRVGEGTTIMDESKHKTTEKLGQHLDVVSKKDMVMMQLIMIAPCFFMRLSMDNDAYWIIQSGRYVLHHGIPTVDPLSFHIGLHYVMQQWLTAVTYAYLYDTFGVIGLFLLVMGIFVAIVLILFRLCMLLSDNNMFISYIVTISDVIILFIYMTTRPYPISMLIFLLEIFILEKYVHTTNWRYLIAIPVLSLCLINLHGAIWPFFFIIFVPYLLDSFRFKITFIKGEGYPRKKLLVAFGLAFLAGYANPYGWELMTYLFRSYGNENISGYVSEMGSPNFQNFSGIYVFAILLVVILVFILAKPPKSKLRYALLLLGTCYMALSSYRNLSLFAICGIPMLAYTLRNVIPKIKTTNRINPKRQYILLVLFLVVVVVTASGRLYQSRNWQDTSVPDKAVTYILQHYDLTKVRLFAGYNWGGYAEFRGIKPFIDARAEVFIKENNKKADILNDLVALDAGELPYQTFIKKYKLNTFIVAHKDLLAVYLAEDPDYALVYHDKDFMLFRKLI